MSSGDSVHSGRSQTRYSTPVPELDDHRTRGRLNSVPVVEIDRSDSPPGQEAIRRGSVDGLNTLGVYDGPIARDFENAIVEDDDESIRSAARRQTSFNPMVRRETVTRRSRVHEERNNEHSRDSSPSSQSSSPPNSVDAFADPRRRGRANTLDSHSQRPSELDGILRTHSIATQRRPTFSNESLIRVPEGVPSILEEDDDDRRLIIDYEELEEFVALSQQKKVNDLQLGRKNSNIPHHARVFHDVRARVDRDDACNPEELPMALKVNTSETFHDEKSDDAMQEKLALLEPKADKQRTRFSFFSSECPDAIHATQLGDLLLEGERFRDLFEPNPDGGVWWLDVNNPTEEELHTLGRAFSMHPLTSEDIIMQESREKVELFDAYYFVCFRSYVMDKKSEEFLDSINIYMVVWREGVLSFSFSDTPHVDNVRRRSGKLRNQFSLSSDWICYAMMYVFSLLCFERHVLTEIVTTSSIVSPRSFVKSNSRRSLSKMRCSSPAPRTSTNSYLASVRCARRSCLSCAFSAAKPTSSKDLPNAATQNTA